MNSPENVFRDPPKEFSVMPFWFWNDNLSEAELIRQIDDFERHGVYGFVIHPRIGLPENTGWMSDKMISCMKLAVAEAKRRGMPVVLYDDGCIPPARRRDKSCLKIPLLQNARWIKSTFLTAKTCPNFSRDGISLRS